MFWSKLFWIRSRKDEYLGDCGNLEPILVVGTTFRMTPVLWVSDYFHLTTSYLLSRKGSNNVHYFGIHSRSKFILVKLRLFTPYNCIFNQIWWSSIHLVGRSAYRNIEFSNFVKLCILYSPCYWSSTQKSFQEELIKRSHQNYIYWWRHCNIHRKIPKDFSTRNSSKC